MSIFEYNEEVEMRKIREAEYELGKEEGKTEDILIWLSELGEVPKALRDQIIQVRDQNVLRKWLKLAARAKSIEDFTESIMKDFS